MRSRARRCWWCSTPRWTRGSPTIPWSPAPYIRFYAGRPLISPSGHAVGTLCLVDTKPRNVFTATQRRHLERLRRLALDKLELRRLQMAGQVSQRRFENIAATSPDGIICADVEGRITFWNAAAERLFGHPAARRSATTST